MEQMKFGITDDLRAQLKERADEETDGNESMIVRRALRDYFRRTNAEPDRLPTVGDDRAPTLGG